MAAAVVASGAFGFVATSITAAAPPARPTVAGTLVTPDGLVDIPTGRHDSLVDPQAQLSGGPTALRSDDGRTVLYTTFEYAATFDRRRQTATAGEVIGSSVLRVKDTSSGVDQVISRDATSVAWAGSGPVAFVQVDAPFRAGATRRGQVLVQAGVGDAAAAWTTKPGNYAVLAWAAGRLLVQETPDDREGGGELLAFDGPGRSRVLGGTDAALLGLSPDGTKAFISTVSGPGATSLALIDTASGAAVGVVDTSGAPAGVTLGAPSPFGAWDGDDVVVSYGQSLATFHLDAGPAVLKLTNYVAVPRSTAPFVRDPYFTKNHTHVVLLSLDHLPVDASPGQAAPEFDGKYVVVDCTVASGLCTTQSLNESADGRQVSFLRNPSRPRHVSVEEES